MPDIETCPNCKGRGVCMVTGPDPEGCPTCHGRGIVTADAR